MTEKTVFYQVGTAKVLIQPAVRRHYKLTVNASPHYWL